MPASPLKNNQRLKNRRSSEKEASDIRDMESLITQHRRDILQTRKIVVYLIHKLQEDVIMCPCPEEMEPSSFHILWGEKENAVSLLVKLSGLLFKILPLEQQLYTGKTLSPESMGEESMPLATEDKAILERYLEKATGAGYKV